MLVLCFSFAIETLDLFCSLRNVIKFYSLTLVTHFCNKHSSYTKIYIIIKGLPKTNTSFDFKQTRYSYNNSNCVVNIYICKHVRKPLELVCVLIIIVARYHLLLLKKNLFCRYCQVPVVIPFNHVWSYYQNII